MRTAYGGGMRLPRAARAVAQSGRNVLSDEVERAIDAMLAGPLPESVARSIVQHRVLERMVSAVELDQAVARALDSAAVQRALAGAIDSPLAEALAVHIAQSEAFSRALREAVAQQTTSFGSELASALRQRARTADNSVGRHAGEATRFGGLVSRAIGLVVDAGIAHVMFLVVAASVGLVLSLAGSLDPRWVKGTLAGGGWGIVVDGVLRLVLDRDRPDPRDARHACSRGPGRRWAPFGLARAGQARRARARDHPALRRIPARARGPPASSAARLPRRHGRPLRMILLVAILVAVLVLDSPWSIVVIVVGCILEIGEIAVLRRWSKRIDRRTAATTGSEAMIGREAEVVEECRPVGTVRVNGELWAARCSEGAGAARPCASRRRRADARRLAAAARPLGVVLVRRAGPRPGLLSRDPSGVEERRRARARRGSRARP